MIPSQQTLRTSLPLRTSGHNNHSGVGQLLAAAVVSHHFREVLLHDPELALKNGYLGETFPLTREERALVISIRADSLTDLAMQLSRTLGKSY